MREIKFRAYGPNCKIMWDWEALKRIADTVGWEHFDAGERALMQYTGLKDIGGVEIYECDIVREAFLGFKFHVQFNTVTAQFEAVPIDENPWHSIPLFERDFTVIGNIYENPELLESL